MSQATNKHQRWLISGSLLLLLVVSQQCHCLDQAESLHQHASHHKHEEHGHQLHDQHDKHQMLAAPLDSAGNSQNSTQGTLAALTMQEEQRQPATDQAVAGQIISTKPREHSTSPTVTITADPRHLLTGGGAPRVIIDLSHPLENQTLYWPALPTGFKYESFNDGDRKNERNESYYVKSDGFRMGVHCGTHLDAPRHFNRAGWTVEQIPLERLIDVHVTVIDVSEQVSANRNYSFVRTDFLSKETNQSLVSPGSVVLMYTGISQFYNQGAKAYFGTDGRNISQMMIPGFSKEAAEYLVSIGVFGVGLDAASADSSEKHGANNTIDPVAHMIFNGANIYILENISNRLLELLKQPTQMRLVIAPLPITGGSGSPIRLLAVSSSHSELPVTTNSATSVSELVPTVFFSLCISVFFWLSAHSGRPY